MPRFSSKSLRERPSAHRAIAEAEVRVLASRALLMELVAKLWQQVLNEEHITHPGACDISDSLFRCGARLCGSR